ncbi:hypothetical protein Y032_0010g924 [Ancylostoma ceylanicum]|uniref:Uncharacterized protein n=1 Tax=Ancylostoma ceylanicum TaxID=53326 RepID=A0A016VHE0_9BILA|nr:hypothetical protein Y032_0010g924 [Ancylostoma ceylanicum]
MVNLYCIPLYIFIHNPTQHKTKTPEYPQAAYVCDRDAHDVPPRLTRFHQVCAFRGGLHVDHRFRRDDEEGLPFREGEDEVSACLVSSENFLMLARNRLLFTLVKEGSRLTDSGQASTAATTQEKAINTRILMSKVREALFESLWNTIR